jgi:uncharacterized coiled-coil protein SlyX
MSDTEAWKLLMEKYGITRTHTPTPVKNAPLTDSDRRITALEAALADASRQINVLNEIVARLERRFEDAQDASEQHAVNAVIKALKQPPAADTPNHELTYPCQTEGCPRKRAKYQTHCKKCHFNLHGVKKVNQ